MVVQQTVLLCLQITVRRRCCIAAGASEAVAVVAVIAAIDHSHNHNHNPWKYSIFCRRRFLCPASSPPWSSLRSLQTSNHRLYKITIGQTDRKPMRRWKSVIGTFRSSRYLHTPTKTDIREEKKIWRKMNKWPLLQAINSFPSNQQILKIKSHARTFFFLYFHFVVVAMVVVVVALSSRDFFAHLKHQLYRMCVYVL